MLFRREEQLVLLMRLEFCLHLVRREAGGKSTPRVPLCTGIRTSSAELIT